MASQEPASHRVARSLLKMLLNDFGMGDNQEICANVVFEGDMPSLASTNSQHLLLSLIGAIPATANALVAAHIVELRGGQGQKVTVDLRRGHNYIDPNIGMIPTINGQASYPQRTVQERRQVRETNLGLGDYIGPRHGKPILEKLF